ncbi:hypothetical protein [Streptosporangium vulgare]|uniref:Uncharacterized protein n=1 Tax=Streptosporangium vulgare TaxID=46190 RepID=A0ABV5TL67_9ACTN
MDELIAERGWPVKSSNPARRALADALAALHRLGQDDFLPLLREYAATTERLASVEVDALLERPDLIGMAEAVVVWTAVGDAVLASLRRLAHEAETTRRLAPPEGTAGRSAPSGGTAGRSAPPEAPGRRPAPPESPSRRPAPPEDPTGRPVPSDGGDTREG